MVEITVGFYLKRHNHAKKIIFINIVHLPEKDDIYFQTCIWPSMTF